MTVHDIASFLGGYVIGNGAVTIDGVRSLDEAGGSHVSFLHRPEYLTMANNSNAGAIITSDVSLKKGSLIIVDRPKVSYRKLMEWFYDEDNASCNISERAFIDEDVEIGHGTSICDGSVVSRGVKIGNDSFISSNVTIGEGVVIGDCVSIYPGVVVYPYVFIGNRVIVHANAVIGVDGFGFQRDENGKLNRINQVGTVRIGNDVEIGACTCVERATLSETIIEDGAKIHCHVVIGHNVYIGNDVLIIGQSGVAGSTNIGNCSNLYAQTFVSGHRDIGPKTTLLAKSGLIENVSGHSVYGGMPAIEASVWRKNTVIIKKIYEIIRAIRRNRLD